MFLPLAGTSMGEIIVHEDGLALDDPTLVEGLPGIGLVGKIAADHLVEAFEMDHYASIYCDGIPSVGVYHAGDASVRAPVRLYADAERDLVVLQSDVPVSAESAEDFASCVVGWIARNDVRPIFLSGRPSREQGAPLEVEPQGSPGVRGIATGDAAALLDDAGIEAPPESGAVSGPTGALLHDAAREGIDGVGLVVESDPNFPDPLAARALLEAGVGPIADLDVAVDVLSDRAADIRKQKQQLATQMQEATSEESSQAQPLRMYQ
jgi:uncharacterized protein